MYKKTVKILIICAVMLILTSCYSSQIANDLIAARKKDIINKTHNDQVQKVVDTYFVSGSDIKKALDKLESQGFKITEFSIDGYRDYPDGDFKLYNFYSPEIAFEHKMKFEGNYKYSYGATIYDTYEILTDTVIIGIHSNIDGTKIKDATATFAG